MSKYSHADECKVFNDPVHGTIRLHPLLVKIIDTPEFQRLRHIKQLGGVYHVYPGAQHNRFEHSIGTAHLAGKLVRHLKDVHSKDCPNSEGYVHVDITEKDILCVEIAGLCHDLGHGPFSHLFDKKFVKSLQGSAFDENLKKIKKWEHEDGSCEMFEKVMKKESVKTYMMENMNEEMRLNDEDKKFIKRMIKPIKSKEIVSDATRYDGRSKEKSFLFEIISNEKSGVDVDKWDYFARDCHHLGIANGFDHNRFIEFTRVVIDENKKKRICARDKEVFNLYEMFHTRFSLHKRAYQHKAVNAMEHMICDALLKANDAIKVPGEDNKRCSISECVLEENLGSFCNLDDRVLQKIEHSESENLEPARKILKRIATGDHYRCIGSEIISDEKMSAMPDDKKKEVVTKIQETIGSICGGEVKVSFIPLNYGNKEKDPIERYRFYSKKKPNKAKEIKREKVSTLLPSKFQEHLVQVFCTKEQLTSAEFENARKAFKSWHRTMFEKK